MKVRLLPPVTSGHMIFALENDAGSFIRFLNLVRKDTIPGMIRRPINLLVAQMHGVDSASTKSVGSCLHQPGLRLMIFMVGSDSVLIFLPTACWLLMLQRAKENGTSRRSITMCGIAIFLRHLHW